MLAPETQYRGPTSWMYEAPCEGLSELFYSDDPPEQRAALAVCAVCPFVPECTAYTAWAESGAAAMDIHGIWAGQTAEDRRRSRVRLLEVAS